MHLLEPSPAVSGSARRGNSWPSGRQERLPFAPAVVDSLHWRLSDPRLLVSSFGRHLRAAGLWLLAMRLATCILVLLVLSHAQAREARRGALATTQRPAAAEQLPVPSSPESDRSRLISRPSSSHILAPLSCVLQARPARRALLAGEQELADPSSSMAAPGPVEGEAPAPAPATADGIEIDMGAVMFSPEVLPEPCDAPNDPPGCI